MNANKIRVVLIFSFLLPILSINEIYCAAAAIAQTDNINLELIKAIDLRDIEKVKMLIASGADVNDYYISGYTPLTLAVYANTIMVKLLIEANANVNAFDRFGVTALMYSLKNDRGSSAKLLINSGADINAVDKYGNTALIWAMHGHIEMVKLLLNAGVDLDIRDKKDKIIDTAFDIAIARAEHNTDYAKLRDLFQNEPERRANLVKERQESIAREINAGILSMPTSLSNIIAGYIVSDYKDIATDK